MPQLCIIFDLDDTLYLEHDYVLSGFRAVGQWVKTTLGLDGFYQHASKCYELGERKETLQKALLACGRQPDAALLSAMLDVYRTHHPDLTLPLDTASCLASLSEFASLGIITDGRPHAQFAKCQQLGLNDKVSCIVCTGVWGEVFYKPHHRAFEHMERELGHGQDTFIYVADNPLKDFTAPLARGWYTVRVRRRGGLHAHLDSLAEHQPHCELQDLSGLSQVISTLVT